eukprot:141600_1
MADVCVRIGTNHSVPLNTHQTIDRYDWINLIWCECTDLNYQWTDTQVHVSRHNHARTQPIRYSFTAVSANDVLFYPITNTVVKFTSFTSLKSTLEQRPRCMLPTA